MAPLGQFINWKPPHRGMRLAAHALIRRVLPSETAIIDRTVATMAGPADLISWLKHHREGAPEFGRDHIPAGQSDRVPRVYAES